MSIEVTIEGEVKQVTAREFNGKSTPILVIDTTDKPEYPEAVAVEFYGKAAGQADGVSVGDTVSIEARVRSREGRGGGWFTSVNGWKCGVAERASGHASQPSGDGADGANDAPPF